MRAALSCLVLVLLLGACDPDRESAPTERVTPGASEIAAISETPQPSKAPAVKGQQQCRSVAPDEGDAVDNQGITARLCVSDPTPEVGTAVVFTVQARDPDARLFGLTGCAPNQLTFGDETHMCTGGPACAAGGSGAAKEPGRLRDEVKHVYKHAGRFTAALELQSGSQCPHPYASKATVNLRVVVHNAGG